MDGIVKVFDDFTAEKFISAVEIEVNSFSFDAGKTAMELTLMPEEKQTLLRQVIDSCIYTLAHTDRTDGRNEISAEVCRRLNPPGDPMPDVGDRFMRMHPTLQQTAAKLFCCYLDMAEVVEYEDVIEDLRSEYGSRWYCFPLI